MTPPTDEVIAARKVAKRATQAAYRLANAEKRRASQAAYRLANAEKLTAKRLANPTKYAATRAAYVAANREKLAAGCARWRAENKEKAAAAVARWQTANKERLVAYSKEYRKSPAGRASQAARRQTTSYKTTVESWKRAHPDKLRVHSAKSYLRLSLIPMFRLSQRMSGAVRRSLRSIRNGQTARAQSSKWLDLVGYTAVELYAHIERQFLPRMGWHNLPKWHIDHIIPLSSFRFETADDPEFKAAWALTNLRPLWAVDNIRKHAKREFLV